MVIAGKTASQLEEVAGNSKTITDEVNGIAETLETQADAIKQINNGVEQINDVVQTNSASSQDVQLQVEMSSEAESLNELISHLRVAEQ